MADVLIDYHLYHFYNWEGCKINRLLSSQERQLISLFLSKSDVINKERLAIQLLNVTFEHLQCSELMKRIAQDYLFAFLDFERSNVHQSHNYRSHMTHTAYVYLLGFYLEELYEKPYTCLNMTYFDFFRASGNLSTYLYNTNFEMVKFRRRWAYTAFFHDIHYLTEENFRSLSVKARSELGVEDMYTLDIREPYDLLFVPSMAEIRRFFRLEAKSGLSFSDDALMILAERLAFRYGNHQASTLYNSLRLQISDNQKASRWEHGLMGAVYSLRKYFSSLGEYLQTENRSTSMSELSLQRHTLYNECLDFTDGIAASAFHNIRYWKSGVFGAKTKIKHSKLPLLYTLILADEMQVWNRSLAVKRQRMERTDNPGIGRNKLRDMIFGIWDGMIREFSLQGVKNDSYVLPFFTERGKDKDESIRHYEVISEADNQPVILRQYNPDCPYSNSMRVSFRGLAEESWDQIELLKIVKPDGYNIRKDWILLTEFWQEYMRDRPTLTEFFVFFQRAEAVFHRIVVATSEHKYYLLYRSQQELLSLYYLNPLARLSQISQCILPWIPYDHNRIKLTDPGMNPDALPTNTEGAMNISFSSAHDLFSAVSEVLDVDDVAKVILKQFQETPNSQISEAMISAARYMLDLVNKLAYNRIFV